MKNEIDSKLQEIKIEKGKVKVSRNIYLLASGLFTLSGFANAVFISDANVLLPMICFASAGMCGITGGLEAKMLKLIKKTEKEIEEQKMFKK